MSPSPAESFCVIATDAHGQPVRCSYCARDVDRVAVLPLTDRPGLEERIRAADGEDLWLGLCAHCMLEIAKAFELSRKCDP